MFFYHCIESILYCSKENFERFIKENKQMIHLRPQISILTYEAGTKNSIQVYDSDFLYVQSNKSFIVKRTFVYLFITSAIIWNITIME